MKTRYLIFLSLMALAFTVCLNWIDHRKDVSPNVVQGDPVTDTLVSIQHQGRLVVADINVNAEATSHLKSSVFDASVVSSKTVHMEVYLDLAQVSSDWVSTQDKIVTISIPKGAIQCTMVTTDSKSIPNASWAYTFEPGVRNDLEKTNADQILTQLNTESKNYLNAESPLVAAQLERLFGAVLLKQGYHVVARLT